MTTPTLDPALEYARRGWLVAPLHSVQDGRCSCGSLATRSHKSAGKHPRTAHGLKEASKDLPTVKHWFGRQFPGANVAVVTGRVSGIWVLDIDIDKGGEETLAGLPVLPPTLEIRTGTGGRHLYFATGDDEIRTGKDVLGPGLDLRGEGGYVVAPPGRNYAGAYTVLHDRPVATLPDDHPVLERARRSKGPPPLPIPEPRQGPAGPMRERLAGFVRSQTDALARVTEGNRYDATRDCARTCGGILHYGDMSVDEVRLRILDACAANGMLERKDGTKDAHKAIDWGIQQGLAAPLYLEDRPAPGSTPRAPGPSAPPPRASSSPPPPRAENRPPPEDTPPPPLDLDAILEDMRHASTDEKLRMLAELTASAASLARHPGIHAFMTRARALNGKGVSAAVQDLRRALRSQAPGTGRAPMSEAVGWPAEWPDFDVPEGYMASARGVYRLEQAGDTVIPSLVAHEPVAVVGLRVDVGTGRESVVLGFRRLGAWRRLVVPREHSRDSRALVDYAGQGLPVSSVTSRALVSWLEACEVAAGPDLAVERCTTRLGWHGDLYIAGPGGPLELDDPHEVRTGWQTSGTWEGWLAALATVTDQPVAWLALYAAATAPLLRWLNLGHCPIIDVSGPRGRGKTTCLRIAASGWGRPDELAGGTITTWSDSPTSIERNAASTWDAPVLLDDSRRAPRPELVGGTLYTLAQGRGRGRGTPGGVLRTANWRTTVLSTGESPVVETTEAGGARARVLSISRTPAISNRETAKRVEAGIYANHGHLGPRLAAHALTLGPELARRYSQILADLAASHPTDTRLLSIAAAIHVAAGVCTEIGVPRPEADWHGELTRALEFSAEGADQSGRALDLVREELNRRAAAYRGREARLGRLGDVAIPHGGYRGVWLYRDRGGPLLGLYDATLREILTDAGHDLAPVVQQWREAGILRKANHGRLTKETFTHDGKKMTHPMWSFDPAKVLLEALDPMDPSVDPSQDPQ